MATTSLSHAPSSTLHRADRLAALAEVLAAAGEVVTRAPGQGLLDRVRDGEVLAGWPQEEHDDLARGAALLVESRIARESPGRVRADHDRLFASSYRSVPALPLSRALAAVAAACRSDRPELREAARAAHDPQLARWLTQVAQRSTTFFYQGVAAAGLGALGAVGRAPSE